MTRFALTLFALGTLGGGAFASEGPSSFICGVWPDRILFFDPSTDSFSEGLRLRHGAVTASAHTPDRSRVFVVTDRMQSVEVIDPMAKEVVDELKLSTPDKRVWIHRVFPGPTGARVYLYVSVVRLETDRFVREADYDMVHYDLEKDEVLRTFSLPPEASDGGRPSIYVAPDEKTFYAVGGDVLQIDAESFEILDRIVLSEPLHPGYGAMRGARLTETGEPGVLYGIFRTEEPVQKKDLFGVLRIDLYEKEVESFELGPELDLGRFALSPDGKRGYAGLNDMVIVDMVEKKILRIEEGFERGRTNTSLIVSDDGSKIYVSGVGDTMYIYDAETLERVKSVFAGGDFMLAPMPVPSTRSAAGK